MPSPSPAENRRLRVLFGQAATRLTEDAGGIVLGLAVPHLAGPAGETILDAPGVIEAPAAGTLLLVGTESLAGVFVRPLRGPLDDLALAVYREVLAHTRGWHVGRVWNYVPAINGETTGLENYRRFNLGRWQAYRDAFGGHFSDHLPAASAVGLRDDHLVTVFLAGRTPVRAVENPQQVAAWRYPEAYGPKPPSFARATVTGTPGARRAWISGTASIMGHESVGVGNLDRQIDLTLSNLGLVIDALSLPPLGSKSGVRHDAKVYLRDAAALPNVRDRLEAAGLSATGPAPPIFLHADICRRELDIEIEISSTEG